MKHQQIIQEIDSQHYLFNIFFEKRSSLRIALGKRCINMRVPRRTHSVFLESYLQKAHRWIQQMGLENPAIHTYYSLKHYQDGDLIRTVDSSPYVIRLLESESLGVQLDNNTIYMSGTRNLGLKTKNDKLPLLISRAFSKRFKTTFQSRVIAINNDWNQSTINSIRLKYNRSNWGSCSTNNNLNFSTRLFLLPQDLQDYIIIHELAHLVEHNHSSKFWKLVSDKYPDHKKAESWLRTEGLNYDF